MYYKDFLYFMNNTFLFCNYYKKKVNKNIYLPLYDGIHKL